MAKRNNAGRLAGLAGLAALGYMALKDKEAPVEDRTGTPVAPEADLGDFNQANYGGQGVELGAPSKGASTGGPDERYMAGASAPLSKGTPTDKRYLPVS